MNEDQRSQLRQLHFGIPIDGKNPFSKYTSMRFVVEDIYIKPAVRMTQRSKYADPNAQEYLDVKQELAILFNNQMREREYERVPERTPILVAMAWLHSAGHRADLDNIYKTVTDSMNNIVYPDDRWIDRAVLSRGKVGDANGAIFDVVYYDENKPVAVEEASQYSTRN